MVMDSFHEQTEPTLSEDTKAKYLARFQSFARRFAKDANKDDLTPDEVVAHLILLKPTLSMTSWRTYKNAALYALRTLHPAHELAITALEEESSAALARKTVNTSGRKGKRVPESAWKALQTGLSKRIKDEHRHAQGLLDFLSSSLITGLRPVEWCFSTIAKHAATGRDVIRVRNAKHTNGRANGEYREIFIDELTAEERSGIERALAYCSASTEEQAEQIITALRNELGIVRGSAIVTAKQPQSSVTLYSFRHQFIADAKLTFDDPVMISALVGHNSTKTAFQHYGKRRFGSSQTRVYPTPESLEAVQRVHLEVYKEFVADRAARRPFTL